MNTKSSLAALLVLFSFLQSCHAQSKNIKNATAFAKAVAYGKEMRDLDGNTVARHDTAYFLYVEVKGHHQPQITSIEYNGRLFSGAVHPVTEKRIEAGINKSTGKKVFITTNSANSLWRIELNPPSSINKKTSNSKKMIVKGRANNQPFTLTIKTVVLLEGDIAV